MSDVPALQAPVAGSPSVAADTSRLSSKANLKQAAQQFEGIFINMMLKSARSAKLSDGLLDSDALDQFRDMQDVNVAETMAKHMPLGIGKALADFLSKDQPDLKEGEETPT